MAIAVISIVVALVSNIAIVRTAWAGEVEWERLSAAAIEAYRQGRFAEAEAALKAALAEAAQELGDRHVVFSLENLGEFYRRAGRFPEAEAMHRRALDVAEATRVCSSAPLPAYQAAPDNDEPHAGLAICPSAGHETAAVVAEQAHQLFTFRRLSMTACAAVPLQSRGQRATATVLPFRSMADSSAVS